MPNRGSVRTCFIVVLPLFAWLHAHALTRVGVFIGNNRGARGDADLEYAEKDARGMAATLKEFGGLDSTGGLVLATPSLAEVREALDRVRRRANELRKRGEPVHVYLFYSGHGSADGFHFPDGVLGLQDLRAVLRAMDADFRILIADACYSGSLIGSKGGTKGGRPGPQVEVRYREEARAEGTVILTSSSATQPSSESKSLEGALFTTHLLRAMRGAADYDKDGDVTLWEAYSYAKARLKEGLAAPVQTPYFSEEARGSDPLVLTRLPIGSPGAVSRPVRISRLGTKGGSARMASRGISLGAAFDPFFPERDEPSFLLRMSLQGVRPSSWGWSAGLGWLEPRDMEDRVYGTERGYLLHAGIIRNLPAGPSAEAFAGLEADIWWARTVVELTRFEPARPLRAWGPIAGPRATLGIAIPLVAGFRVPLAFHAGYYWSPLWKEEWVPDAAVSLSLQFR